jgi:hypothetical protein
MWIYNNSNGNLSFNGELVGTGYSGNTEGLNNPVLSSLHNVGPIPSGMWIIGDFFDDFGGKGAIVTRLTPEPETVTFGRSGFMIHGDNSHLNHSASDGCIILAHPIRQQIKDSGDTSLMVV